MPDPRVNRNLFLGAKLWAVGGVHGKEVLTDLPDIGLILPPQIGLHGSQSVYVRVMIEFSKPDGGDD